MRCQSLILLCYGGLSVQEAAAYQAGIDDLAWWQKGQQFLEIRQIREHLLKSEEGKR
jgi:hypothetical protein